MKIAVLVEHRMGEIRDITWELLTLGVKLAEEMEGEGELVALLVGHEVEAFAKRLTSFAEEVFVVEDERLKDSEAFQITVASLLKDLKPFLTLMGHTSFGIELAPALAVQMDLPLATDCIDVSIHEGKPLVIRQLYGGKVNAEVSFCDAWGYLVTVREGSFKPGEGSFRGKVIRLDSPLTEEIEHKKHLSYEEAEVGEVDITQADIIVAVGRGIKDKENIPLVEEVADALGGVVACSRPVADAGWLPKDRQVGASAKVVKPKLYLAMGISGAFQHIAGMRGSEMVVAINKDPDAPIFKEADYGIVEDLFQVVPALQKVIEEFK
jgi:electron transfer flavoprotein alpha subunit